MASHLVGMTVLVLHDWNNWHFLLQANIFGTEQDRVNCSFYYKVHHHFPPILLQLSLSQIGACRHGDRCSRKHIKPPFSQTILLPNVYHNPAHDPVCKLTEKELQEGFDAVYEDLYCELAKFGHLLELHVSWSVVSLFNCSKVYRKVCDNVGDHLIGNVYARYEWETEAQAAVDSCNERWYAGMFDVSCTDLYANSFIVDRQTLIRRTLPCHRLSWSLLPSKRKWRVQSRRIL